MLREISLLYFYIVNPFLEKVHMTPEVSEQGSQADDCPLIHQQMESRWCVGLSQIGREGDKVMTWETLRVELAIIWYCP